MQIQFTIFPAVSNHQPTMEYIGMDVHKRYCQVAILDDDSTNPDECRLRTERDELEEFAREHQGAQVAIEATRNYWFVYDCLEPQLDVAVANPHKTGLIGDQKVKSDRLDAKRLAVLLQVDALAASYIPPDEFREARKLVRRRKALVNEKHPQYLLCDEFTNLTLITSALDETELLTTPALITAFVDSDVLTKADAQAQLSDIAAMRSWEGNAYYQRARRVLDQL